jgi:FkbM family methyltransferase
MIVLRASWAVNEPLRMLFAETLGRRTDEPRRYTLRGSGCAVFLRSRGSDLRVFHEVFCYQGYALSDRARSALTKAPVGIDAGAHIGLFTLFLCEAVPGVSVRAFEPDPENATIARVNLETLINAGRVELVEAAAGTCHGPIPFMTGLGMTSRRAPPERAKTSVSQVDLFEHLDGVGLLKLDIEGAEWDILRDPRWRKHMPSCLFMEWHALIEDQREPDPMNELERLLVGADEVEHTVFDRGLVGHVWAYR